MTLENDSDDSLTFILKTEHSFELEQSDSDNENNLELVAGRNKKKLFKIKSKFITVTNKPQ